MVNSFFNFYLVSLFNPKFKNNTPFRRFGLYHSANYEL